MVGGKENAGAPDAAAAVHKQAAVGSAAQALLPQALAGGGRYGKNGGWKDKTGQ